jgi:hypothetical protein
MVTLSTSILWLFAIACLVSLIVPFLRDKVVGKLTYKEIVPSLPHFLFVLIPMSAIFGIASQFGVNVANTLPHFLGAATAIFLLSRIGLPPQLSGILLLIGAFLYTNSSEVEGYLVSGSALMFGLLSWKIADNFLRKPTYDDVLPPVIWLSGVMWIALSAESADMPVQQGLLLGVISVCLLMRTIFHVVSQFMQDDVYYLKRTVLATTGGLGLLIVITKLLTVPDMAKVAALVGAGMLATFIFAGRSIPVEPDPNDPTAPAPLDPYANLLGTNGIGLLVTIGILFLVATRLWGTLGLVLLAPTALVAPWPGPSQYPGLFFTLRTLLQVFILSFNSNVTGINIMHAYTGAALYAGFIIMAILTLLLRDVLDRRILTAVFLTAGVMVPLGASYLLHAEPTSSLLVSSTVAAVLLSAIAPTMQQPNAAKGYENIVLLPALMIASGITTSGLLEAGANATIQVKSTMIGYSIGLLVVMAVVCWWFFVRPNAKPAEAAE